MFGSETNNINIVELLAEIDWWYIVIAMTLLLVCTKLIWSLFDWLFVEKLGVETKKMKQRREDKELLKTTANLAKVTAENLDKLQKRHIKDEEEFRKSLNDYMEESRKDRKALHDEMTKFTDNRICDRKQSLEIQKELKDSIKNLIDGQQDRDEKINNLTDMFIDKEIDDYRYKILDFATSLSSGKKYNRESYDHILMLHKKYETVLKEHNMKNGLVDESIKYIQNSYQEYLKSGTVDYQ